MELGIEGHGGEERGAHAACSALDVGTTVGLVKETFQGQFLPFLRIETRFERGNARGRGQVSGEIHDRDDGERQQSGGNKGRSL